MSVKIAKGNWSTIMESGGVVPSVFGSSDTRLLCVALVLVAGLAHTCAGCDSLDVVVVAHVDRNHVVQADRGIAEVEEHA